MLNYRFFIPLCLVSAVLSVDSSTSLKKAKPENETIKIEIITTSFIEEKELSANNFIKEARIGLSVINQKLNFSNSEIEILPKINQSHDGPSQQLFVVRTRKIDKISEDLRKYKERIYQLKVNVKERLNFYLEEHKRLPSVIEALKKIKSDSSYDLLLPQNFSFGSPTKIKRTRELTEQEIIDPKEIQERLDFYLKYFQLVKSLCDKLQNLSGSIKEIKKFWEMAMMKLEGAKNWE